ncbi:MAG: dicarboxylate/amino acid:cation symporter [Fibrobacteria bacterium]|nr:dicarboxylate/amino acid:cation symporter [Fibrobacteria bacterium]
MKLPNNFLVIGMAIGFVLGVVSGVYTPGLAEGAAVIGTLFLNALKMVVLPLIIIAVINSILRIGNLSVFGRLGLRTFLYYVATTCLSVGLGIVIAIVFEPGSGVEATLGSIPDSIQDTEKITIFDMLLSLIPGNIFQAAAEFKVLPLIIVSIIFGSAFMIVSKGKGVLPELFEQLEQAVMLVVNWVILFTPIGIFAIVGEKIASAGGDFVSILLGIGKYISVLLGSLGVHALFVLPLLLFLITRRNPFSYMNKVKEALLMAFTTASSAATLPLTRKNVVENTGAKKETADFVLPLGATVNMDGTALYEGVAVVFICQAYGITLGLSAYVTIFVTAILAGVGAAAIPQAGLVTMVVVLKSVGAPIEGIGLLLSVDWLMDRFRTVVNVWGDTVGVAIIGKLNRN